MSYDMTGRTYRYFKGDVLYPFGYGLSYTNFTYSGLKSISSVGKGKPFSVSGNVKNSGPRDGEEVVQLYVAYKNTKGRAPEKALKGFQRIALKAGESKTITFNLTAEDLLLVDENGKSYQPSGQLMISAGGGQPGVKNKTTSNVISKTITIL